MFVLYAYVCVCEEEGVGGWNATVFQVERR